MHEAVSLDVSAAVERAAGDAQPHGLARAALRARQRGARVLETGEGGGAAPPGQTLQVGTLHLCLCVWLPSSENMICWDLKIFLFCHSDLMTCLMSNILITARAFQP